MSTSQRQVGFVDSAVLPYRRSSVRFVQNGFVCANSRLSRPGFVVRSPLKFSQADLKNLSYFSSAASRRSCTFSSIKNLNFHFCISSEAAHDGRLQQRSQEDQKDSAVTSFPKRNPLLKKIAKLASWPVAALCLILPSAFAASAGTIGGMTLETALAGFTASLLLITVSEIGDKTFFISAILAMRYPRTLVLLGALGALSTMTVICILLAQVFQYLPAGLTHYGSIALLVFFGLRTLKQAWDLPNVAAAESDEEKEAEEEVEKAALRIGGDEKGNRLKVIVEAFSLVFLAEWGDRSMLATIALAAAKGPLGVMLGAVLGHAMTTGLAVIGGALLAKYISEKLVGYIGGATFLIFAAATAAGFM